MKKFDKDNIIVFMVVLTAAFLFYNILLRPQVKQLEAVRTQYVSQKSLVKVRSVKKDEIMATRENTEKWKEKLKEIDRQFLKKTEMTVFLKNINQAAAEAGIKIGSVDPLEKRRVESSGVEETSIEVNAVGEYGTILEFIDSLFNGEKLLKVSNVDMIVMKEGTGKNMLEVSMTITLFVSAS
ncbi:MAG: type 4a pilus biogenesis protein PilO [Candidatus Omnitrophota bacterium]